MKNVNSMYICIFMSKKSLFISRNPSLLFTVGLIFCLAFFAKIVDSFVRVSEPANRLTSHTDGQTNFGHKSGSVPLFPSPAPQELPVSDEIEAKDECDDEFDKLLANLSSQGSAV